MSMTTEKIEKILAEIEGDLEIKIKDSHRSKTTNEVIDILLKGRSQSTQQELHDSQSNFSFDTHELKNWKEKNNQLFRVDYYRNIPPTHKGLIGKLVIFCKRVIRKFLRFLIEPILFDQNEFNGAITASINALYNNAIVSQNFMDEMSELKKELIKLDKELDDRIEEVKIEVKDKVESSIENFSVRLTNLDIATTKLQSCIEELNISLDTCNSFMNEAASELVKIQKLEQENEDSKQNIEVLALKHKENKQSIDELAFDVQQSELQILRAIKKGKIQQQSAIKAMNENSCLEGEFKADTEQKNDSINVYDKIDYFEFENYFRGLRKNIKKTQQQYVAYFEGKQNVVDLGCGRGEFLELLEQNNIPAIGVDLYEEFIDYCKLKDLDVVQDDAVSYITNLKEESIDGLFASQLAEHLETSQLVTLCNKAYEKLKQDSYFILETPNPTSLSIYTNGFYMDPSHIKPVHPKTLQYFLQQAGFKNIEIIYTEQSKVDYRLPLLDSETIKNLAHFNDGINLMSDILFGSQDYAIIAQK